jgi:hypothetical protein
MLGGFRGVPVFGTIKTPSILASTQPILGIFDAALLGVEGLDEGKK